MDSHAITPERTALLGWITAEIDKHKASIRALEALRDAPGVMAALMAWSGPDAFPGTGKPSPSPAAIRTSTPIDKSALQVFLSSPSPRMSDDEIADAVAKLIPDGQKGRAGTIHKILHHQTGRIVGKGEIERVMRRFPKRFKEHDRGWWAVVQEGGNMKT